MSKAPQTLWFPSFPPTSMTRAIYKAPASIDKNDPKPFPLEYLKILLQEKNNPNVLLKKAYTKGNPRKTASDFYPVRTSGKEEPVICPVYFWFGCGRFLVGNNPAVSGKSKQMKQMTNHFSKTWSQTGLAAGVAVEANFPEYLQNHL